MNFRIFKFLIAVFFTLSLSNLTAQENDKITAAITNFKYPSSTAVNANHAPKVTQHVANAFQKHSDFNLVDRTTLSNIEEEQKQSRSINTINTENNIGRGKNKVAQYLIIGEISNLVIEKEYEEGVIYYQAQISFLLKVSNTETTEIVASQQMTTNTIKKKVLDGATILVKKFRKKKNKKEDNTGILKAKTEQQAVENALKKLDKSLEEFIKENFK